MTIAPARSILACVTLVALVPALVLAQELRPEDLTTFIERGSAEYAYSRDLVQPRVIMFEPFASDTLDGREVNLLALCHQLVSKLTSTQARRHLDEGPVRRVLLIRTSRAAMERIANPKRQEVLELEESSELNVHLNSFYVHLRGAFDNLEVIS
jgi:hypothetical protein